MIRRLRAWLAGLIAPQEWAIRYERKHLHPLDGTDMDFDADVTMEIEFPDEATMAECCDHVCKKCHNYLFFCFPAGWIPLG